MSILIKKYGISEEELEKFCFEFTEPCDKCFYNKKECNKYLRKHNLQLPFENYEEDDTE